MCKQHTWLETITLVWNGSYSTLAAMRRACARLCPKMLTMLGRQRGQRRTAAKAVGLIRAKLANRYISRWAANNGAVRACCTALHWQCTFMSICILFSWELINLDVSIDIHLNLDKLNTSYIRIYTRIVALKILLPMTICFITQFSFSNCLASSKYSIRFIICAVVLA
jgi:hypothetical protein